METMNPLEAAMLVVEPLSQAQHVAGVLILSPPPGAGPDYVDEMYRTALASPGPIEPQLHRHPHSGLDTRGRWIWQDDENFDLAWHFRRATLPQGAGMDEFWEMAGELYAERLDRSRPMWTMHLIDGLPDGRFAFMTKVHHAVMDGVAGMNFITSALSADPDRRSMPHIFGAREHHVADDGKDHGGDEPVKNTGLRLPNPFAPLRSLVNTAASGAAMLEKVIATEVSHVIAGLTTDTTVARLAAPHTRFNGRAGEDRVIAAGSWPRSRFRAIEEKADVTRNDVVVAMIGGALREWLLERGELPDRSLVSLCPVTVRSHERGPDNSHGNQFGIWLCPLATDSDDPAARLDLVHRAMAEGKKQVAKRGSALSMLVLVPEQISTVLLPKLSIPNIRPGYNFPITNVPGPKTTMYWNGAKVEAIYPVAMVYDGLAMTVTVCSYADQISLTYLAGENVAPDIADLIDRTEKALAALEAAAGG